MEEDFIIKKYELEIKIPLILPTGIPGHLQVDFLIKSLPHMLHNAFQGQIEVKIKELQEGRN